MDENLGRHFLPFPKRGGALATTLPTPPAAVARIYLHVVRRKRMAIAASTWYRAGVELSRSSRAAGREGDHFGFGCSKARPRYHCYLIFRYLRVAVDLNLRSAIFLRRLRLHQRKSILCTPLHAFAEVRPSGRHNKFNTAPTSHAEQAASRADLCVSDRTVCTRLAPGTGSLGQHWNCPLHCGACQGSCRPVGSQLGLFAVGAQHINEVLAFPFNRA